MDHESIYTVTMNRGVVILLGNLAYEIGPLGALAANFGWTVERAPDLPRLRMLAEDRRVVAVLLDAHGLGMSWDEALEAIQRVAPRALTIICHRFSEDISWPELAEAGAFHALPVPFDLREVRQSLGFVEAASQNRRAKVASVLQVA